MASSTARWCRSRGRFAPACVRRSDRSVLAGRQPASVRETRVGTAYFSDCSEQPEMGAWMTSSVLKSADTDWLKEIVDAKQPPLDEFGWNDSGNADRLVAALGTISSTAVNGKCTMPGQAHAGNLTNSSAQKRTLRRRSELVRGRRHRPGRIQAKGIPGIPKQVALENQPCKYAPLGKEEGAQH